MDCGIILGMRKMFLKDMVLALGLVVAGLGMLSARGAEADVVGWVRV